MAGKKFAAEFALRRNVSAQDKILIQDSDDDVVKYAYPPQIASLSGYAYAQSVADLPLLPTNKSIGYIVGQMLYIYVGMGGDTKDGLYQSVGFFVGPQGVQGEKGEKGERGEQGVQGPKGDNGGLSLQELDKYLGTKQYVTGDTLADMLAGYVSNTSLMRDYVTIAKAQDVTGVKNFTAGVQFGGLPMYKSKDDTVYLDANLVVRGAVTMYGMNTTTSPSIFSTLPIDGKTIGRNERGELYVIGGTSGGGSGTGGGISIADLESYLTTNGYATQDWVTGNGYITSDALEPYALKTAIPTNTNQLTNGAGFITGITSSMVTNALGYTPVAVSIGLTSADNNAIGYGYYEGGWPEAGPAMVFGVGNYKAGVHVGAFGSAIRYGYTAGATSFTWRTILDDSNYSNYALPLTGGTVYGNILVTGAITMYYSSDKRLKQNIRKVNASKTLLSLGGIYQYEYIDSEVTKNSTYGGSHYGLIYQNVKGTALKSMCHEREDGYGTLNYFDTNFISLIAGATMESISEVEKLKRKIRSLEAQVKQLESRA